MSKDLSHSLTLVYDGIGQGYSDLLLKVRTGGREIGPNGAATKEVTPLILYLTDPRKCLVRRRGFSRALMWLEILQLLGGVYDREAYERVAPKAAELTHAATAYGPRVRDQVPGIISELQRDPSSRRATVYIGRDSDLKSAVDTGMPCTETWQFFIREGSLDMHVNMRSWDLVWGLGYDLACFVTVQAAVANALGVPLGIYVHTAASAHVYQRDWALEPGVTDELLSLVDVPWEQAASVSRFLLWSLSAGGAPPGTSGFRPWEAEAVTAISKALLKKA